MNKIIAQDKEHLRELIEEEIKKHGNDCNLNHIDVSQITDMSYIFYGSEFNGNISQWDISKVTDMSYMFEDSYFNQELSDWKPISLKNKTDMFKNSEMEKNNKIPYWNEVETKFLKNKIDMYWLNKTLQKKLINKKRRQEKN